MKNLTILCFCIALCQLSFAQSVGLGTGSPDASAALDVSSTNKGMLVPRMTTGQRTTISSPATGLLVFDTNTNSFWFKGGTTWVELIDSTNTLVHANGPDIYMGMTSDVGIGTNDPAQKLHVQGSTVIADNLGIGVTSPNAQLQTSNTTVNRKIVLYESANDENQFYGFGVNPGSLRYQVSGTANDHIFYASTSASNSNPLMRIKGNGNVGIGNINPLHRLDVVIGTRTGTHHAGGLPLYVTGALGAASDGVEFRHTNGTQGIGFGYNTIYAAGSDAEHSLGLQAKGATGVVFARTNGVERLRINGSGNVGIANTDPQNRVDVQQSARTGTHPTGLPLYVTGNLLDASNGVEIRHNDGAQGIGLGRNTIYAAGSNINQDLGLQAKGTSGNLLLKTDGAERMRVTGNGNVGIGVTTPTASLEIFRGTGNEGTLKIRGTIQSSHFNYGNNEDTYIRGGKAGSHILLNDQAGLGNVSIGVVPNHLASLTIARGTGFNGALMIIGTSHPSHFNYATEEHTFIRGGKNGSHVLLNDSPGLGNVGIGTNAPVHKLSVIGNTGINGNLAIGNGTAANAPLQFQNTTVNRKIVLYEGANNDHEFSGFGYSNGEVRYQVKDTIGNHVFYAGKPAGTSKELMRIDGNGNVAVKGNLDVVGSIHAGYQTVWQTFMIGANLTLTMSVNCPSGFRALTCGWESWGEAFAIRGSAPENGGTTWSLKVKNNHNVDLQFAVCVLCARIGD